MHMSANIDWSYPLPEATIAMIEDWIDAGAAP